MRYRGETVAWVAIVLATPFLYAQQNPSYSTNRPVARLGSPILSDSTTSACIQPAGHASLGPTIGPTTSPNAAPGLDSPPFLPPGDPSPKTAAVESQHIPGRMVSAQAVLNSNRLPGRESDPGVFGHTSRFGERFRERFEEWMRPGFRHESDVRKWFLSDHEFDYFASPVSMPFLLEDPRSLTEVRPIFILQGIPNGAPNFQGGHIEFYGTQIRLAFTERFSFIMTKLGFIDINPGSGSTQPGGFGFAEVHLGPKFTFLRHSESGFLAAAGLNFQIPSGPARVYQDTGRVSLVPYVTIGKNFLENRFGSVNLINTTGYAFSGDGERSDYLYNSFHLDWDIANRHKIYPMMELHYVQYTFSGGLRNLNVEGRDLANIGDVNSGGRANLNIAAGLRYKLTEAAQVGFAAEFPLNVRRDLQQFRFTIDLILRF